MTLRGTLGWAGVVIAFLIASPLLLAFYVVKTLLAGVRKVSFRLPSLSEIGVGLIWMGLGLGVLIAVCLGTLYAWDRFFPSSADVKEVYIPVPVPTAAGAKAKLPSCLPVVKGAKVKAKKHWSMPDGTRGVITGVPSQKSCKDNTAYTIEFQGSDSSWCSDKDTFEPIECSKSD